MLSELSSDRTWRRLVRVTSSRTSHPISVVKSAAARCEVSTSSAGLFVRLCRIVGITPVQGNGDIVIVAIVICTLAGFDRTEGRKH